MSLFQHSVLNKYLKEANQEEMKAAYKRLTLFFHNPYIQQNIRESKEEQFQEGFLTSLFVEVLEYTINPNPDFNLTTEFKNERGAKKADGAILQNGAAICVIELKSTKTKDLESIRLQAFDYKANQQKCVYVITSNFEKIRFYINNAVDFEEFDLFKLKYEDFQLLWLCLAKENLLKGIPLAIKEASILKEENITKQIYVDYSLFKRELYTDLIKNNLELEIFPGKEEKEIKLLLFKKSQKLLDRFLFIFFGEDRGLLPPNSISEIIKQWENQSDWGDEVTLYERYKKYFHLLNTGWKGKKHEIFAYNGGLFAPDEILDSIVISDEVLQKHTKVLTAYDFETDVDVNILGHIFENSLNEIEEITAQIEGAEVDIKKSKRKKDGVFYTPKYITKYIVENTVGKLCEEKKTELAIDEKEYLKSRKGRTTKKLKELDKKLAAYRNWLLTLTICDPACGSGAFLNQALDSLIKEHHYIDELKAKLLDVPMIFTEVENSILENNIYGVDINEESGEIAKLSLWLRTAQKGRKLTTLSNNIKCGNSLIDDPEVAGKKAFNWQNEFPEIFKNGGFDVVIGNPPYVTRGMSASLKKALNANFQTAQYQLDLYVAFIERGVSITCQNGFISYIVPNSWLKNMMMSECRKFLLNNLDIKEMVPSLANVFPDASVDTMIFVGIKQKIENETQINEFRDKELYFKHSVNQERFVLNDGFVFDVEVSKEVLPIINKMTTSSSFMGDLFDVTRGINPYDKYRGQLPEIIKSRAYHANYKKDETFLPELKGMHTARYSYNWDNKHFISYGNWLAAPRQLKYFEGHRIVFREILGKTLVSTLITEDFKIDRSLYIAKLEEDFKDSFDMKYVLGILNSKVMAFYFRYTNNEFDNLFPKIRVAEFKKLPIKNADIEEQKKLSELVERMLALTLSFNSYVKNFLYLIINKLEIEKSSKKLKNWHELNFKEILKELKKAKIKLSLSDEAEWMQYFNEQKQKAQKLKSEIDKTDREIDQMVYELYGLTEEEIGIVEESAK